jgi:hypothetical protein
MRYTVRMGIQNWMVWDRETHRPATVDEKPAVKLSKNEASELAAALNTLPADRPSYFTPRSQTAPVPPQGKEERFTHLSIGVLEA